MDAIATSQFVKVNEELGLIMGWAIVCTEKGEPYFDLHGDHIPPDSMIKAATDFMVHSRVGKDMHRGDQTGSVVFAFPMTADIAKAFEIDCDREGLMIAWRPDNADTLGKFKSGEFTGFSIAGSYGDIEEVPDA